MDLGFNKIAFCVLGTGLLIIGVNELSHSFFHEAHHETAGYFVDVPEVVPAGEPVVEEGPRDYAVLISSGNIDAGKAVAVKCLQCHSFEAGGKPLQGPALYDVVGRDVASVPGFSYSAGAGGLADREGVWDYASLDRFIEAPKKYAPGTAMNFVGVKKQQDRNDLLAYMRTLTSGEPLPLPPPLPPEATLVAGEPPVDGATPPVDGAAPPADGVVPATGDAPAAPAATVEPAPTPAPAQPN